MVTSICLSSIQIFLVNLNGAAENGTGARVRAMLARCYGPTGMKNARTAESYSSAKTPIFTYRMTIFAPATRRSLSGGRAFFDGSEISSEFVGGQCASWRLPPKAAVSTYGRHSFVEGIRNGGLDFVKAAVGSNLGHGDCLLYDGFFSFAVVRQIENFAFHLILFKA